MLSSKRYLALQYFDVSPVGGRRLAPNSSLLSTIGAAPFPFSFVKSGKVETKDDLASKDDDEDGQGLRLGETLETSAGPGAGVAVSHDAIHSTTITLKYVRSPRERKSLFIESVSVHHDVCGYWYTNV